MSAKSYGHGIGAGDVNGDGRTDIVTPQGWFEAPPDPRTRDWKFHPEFNLGSTSFIFVIDLNEDGLPDLLTANAHDYGIFWMEQRPDHTWVKHVYGSRAGAGMQIPVADIDGDGDLDFAVGGKSGLFLFENLTKAHGRKNP